MALEDGRDLRRKSFFRHFGFCKILRTVNTRFIAQRLPFHCSKLAVLNYDINIFSDVSPKIPYETLMRQLLVFS